jgi:hypothetical protein
MAHSRISLLSLILTIVLSPGLVPAQEKQETNSVALREKAFALLESVAGQLGTLQSGENRARLASNIVDSIWQHDEQRARALLTLVQDDIRAGLQNPESQDPRDQHTLMVFLKLRMDTAERVAKHDAELALAFLKSTELTSYKKLPYGVVENERALELRLAHQLAKQNPETALKLGRQSLERGFSPDLISLFRQLNRNHRDQAQVLYKEMVVKVRERDLTKDWEAVYFAQNLAQSFTPPAVDEATFRELINFFIATSLAHGCGNKMADDDQRQQFCWQIAPLVARMEKVDPVRATRLKQWTSEEEGGQDRLTYYEMVQLAEDATVDEILELVAKYPQLETQIQMQALRKAEMSGDLDRARKIANDLRDPQLRRAISARLDRYKVLESVNEELIQEVQKRLRTLRTDKERVQFLLDLSSRSNQKMALTLITQAGGMIDAMSPGKDQTEAQMKLAAMYCLAKSDRGLAIMESLMPKLNELVAAAAKLDGYDNRYLRDGEWNMTGEGGVGDLLTQLAQNAQYFAWFDFDRAVSLAAQFERQEIRLMAQLKLAQGLLAGPPSGFTAR